MSDHLFFLDTQSYGKYSREMAKRLGCAAAIFIGELVEKRKYHSKELINDPKHGDGWFYHTIEAVEDRTGLHKDEQKTAMKRLQEHGMIEVKIFGLPARRHFKINEEKVLEFFGLSKNISSLRNSANCFEDSRKLDCGIPQTPQYIEEHKGRTQTTTTSKKKTDKIKESHPVVVVFFDDEDEKRKLLSEIEISAKDLESYVKEPIEVIKNVLGAYKIAKGTTGIENVGAWLHKAFKDKYKPSVKIPSKKTQEKDKMDDKIEKAEANKLYARKVIKKKWSEFKVKPDERVEFIEFSGEKLYFTDDNFKEKILKFLEKAVNVA